VLDAGQRDGCDPGLAPQELIDKREIPDVPVIDLRAPLRVIRPRPAYILIPVVEFSGSIVYDMARDITASESGRVVGRVYVVGSSPIASQRKAISGVENSKIGNPPKSSRKLICYLPFNPPSGFNTTRGGEAVSGEDRVDLTIFVAVDPAPDRPRPRRRSCAALPPGSGFRRTSAPRSPPPARASSSASATRPRRR